MKILSLILRILLGLFLLMPVAGALGFLPAPTAEMYTPEGWAFMSALMKSGYMMPLIGLTCFVCALLFFIGRTALGAVLLAPFTVNVICFPLVPRRISDQRFLEPRLRPPRPQPLNSLAEPRKVSEFVEMKRGNPGLRSPLACNEAYTFYI